MAAFANFEDSILDALGAPKTAQNRLFVRLWQRAEGGSADFNPFNTTQPAPGARNYNSVGVKEYRSPQQGIQATVQTLLNGRYSPLVHLLRSGHGTAKQEATALANSPWGTGSGVLRLLGSGPVPVPRTASVSDSGSQGLTGAPVASQGLSQLLTSFFLQQAQDALSGHTNPQDSSAGLLQLALARKALGAADQTPALPKGTIPHVTGPQPHPSGGDAQMTLGGKSPYGNIHFDSNVDWQHVNPKLLQSINRVGQAYGVTVTVNSGYRSNQHSIAVGGFAGDPHSKGVAVDAYVNGKPIGDVIPPAVWQKFGITSGAVPNFYRGAPDPEHLQL